MRLSTTFIIAVLLSHSLSAQVFPGPVSPDGTTPLPSTDELLPSSRKWIAAGSSGVSLAGTLAIYLQGADYNYSPEFRIKKNDRQWLHQDKFMHGYLSYTTANMLNGMFTWAGLSKPASAWLAAGGSLAFMSAKEFLDAHDGRYGWSWGDMGGNMAGAALFTSQQLTWGEQRLQLKFSAWPRRYSDPELERQAARQFGSSYPGRLIKNYNQQTFWLSANLKSLGGWERMPAWLNFSVGFGAENMFAAGENYHANPDGAVTFDRRDLPRHRQWYLAPDIDLTRIPTKSKFLKSLFFVMNSVKFPLPALELSQGKLRVHPLMW